MDTSLTVYSMLFYVGLKSRSPFEILGFRRLNLLFYSSRLSQCPYILKITHIEQVVVLIATLQTYSISDG